MSTKIPATVITGFLGAGKTTLIQNLLRNANGKRLALIINEFGEVGVDGEILKGCGIENCPDDDIIELANGCICCTVADDFLPTIEKMLNRPQPPDHIVIETSGLALPKPLVKAFNWPEVRTRVTVDGVIAVVDGPAAAAGRFATDPAGHRRPARRRSVARSREPAGGTVRGPDRLRRPGRAQQDRPDRRWRARPRPRRRSAPIRCGSRRSCRPVSARSIRPSCSDSARPPRTISPARRSHHDGEGGARPRRFRKLRHRRAAPGRSLDLARRGCRRRSMPTTSCG